MEIQNRFAVWSDNMDMSRTMIGGINDDPYAPVPQYCRHHRILSQT